MTSLLMDALLRKNTRRPPVWLMRQAGRYHSHYQGVRAQHSFIDLCRKPDLACEVTMGPIRDFDFDAAILFSDLLFPLDVMGMGLSYEPKPTLKWVLENPSDCKRLQVHSGNAAEKVQELEFQAEALRKIRSHLSPDKSLIGFVGGPLTLFYYAIGESTLAPALLDGRYDAFLESLSDLLWRNMSLQVQGGAEVVAVFDTSAGELDPARFAQFAVDPLVPVLRKFKETHPHIPVIYYSRGTGPAHWTHLSRLPINCMGVDWRGDLCVTLSEWGDRYAIQGNFDPHLLSGSPAELEPKLRTYFDRIRSLSPDLLSGWIAGLGHGVLPTTPEESVRLYVRLQREIFQ